MVEFDVHLSRDGFPVVIHDETLERTTNGQGEVAKHSLKELKALDAGYWFDPSKSSDFSQRARNIGIPTLEEIFQEFPGKKLAIEIKASSSELTRKVLDLVEKYNAVNLCTVGSLEDTVFQELRKIPAATKIFTSRQAAFRLLAEYYLRRRSPKQDSKLVASLPVENKFFDLKKKSWIDWLHNKNMSVYYWTVNNPELMMDLARRGADGIMSDDPGLLKRTLALGCGTAL